MTRTYRYVLAAIGILIMMAFCVRVLSRESQVLTATDLKWSLNQFRESLQENLFRREGDQLATTSEKPSQEEQIENTEEVVIHNKTCRLRTSADPEEIYKYMKTTTVKCEMPVMAGGTAKTAKPYIMNEKWVCLDARYNIVPGKCTVYSFGIDSDWSFDDDMDKRFNCKVYSFDHTIEREDHQRSSNIKFYATGISSAKHENVDRYINILKRLGHENTTIDYLKMDVEGAELQFFEDVFTKTPQVLRNIKQIGMEVHPSRIKNRQKLYLKYVQLLECFGFKLIFGHILDIPRLLFKRNGETRSCCYELVWAQDRHW
ncbi:uncharacterized protein LOC125036644 [Penaeus chinensis]|uniref:uncharacterized protein LOC125036644 n=1 Tax=Penaeus chinensis TaxID=139456 RepID=UPI001FB67714|nr:uncharacterized protein LOC125036644 [Penaeus chinensis]